MKKITAAALVLSICFPVAPAMAAKVCQSDTFASFPVPDYANRESTNRISTNNGTWTADKSGYVVLKGVGYADSGHNWHRVEFYVNDVTVGGGYSHTETTSIHTEHVLLPIDKGDVVKIFVDPSFSSASCYFIPPKFVSPN
jgi:hypothetical protein